MSLYLPDQKLGSRSQPGSSSHKFVIKGRQAGSMHRGHTWVFRAETYETMVAWFEDIKALTEKSGEERNAFVRRHASVRSTSAGSARSASSDGGLEEDEADAVPFSANQSMREQAIRNQSPRPSRPSPGGRFPSDLMVNRNLQAPLSPSSGSSEVGNDLNTMSGGPTQDVHPMYLAQTTAYQPEPVQPVQYSQPVQHQPQTSFVNPYPHAQQAYDPAADNSSYAPVSQAYPVQPNPINQYSQPSLEHDQPIQRQDSNNYGNWMAPAVGGAATGALASEAYRKKQVAQQHLEAQQYQNEDQQYSAEHSRAADFTDATPTQVPERHPDHILPQEIDDTGYVAPSAAPTVQPTAAPIVAPVFDGQSQSHRAGDLDTPGTTSSFLGESEVGATPAFGKTVNGGPVPVDLVDTAEEMAHPGMGKRMNTDISVSDLHVPGEYPKTTVGDATGGARAPSGTATSQQPTTFLKYN
jgi:hypothetical protein